MKYMTKTKTKTKKSSMSEIISQVWYSELTMTLEADPCFERRSYIIPSGVASFDSNSTVGPLYNTIRIDTNWIIKVAIINVLTKYLNHLNAVTTC